MSLISSQSKIEIQNFPNRIFVGGLSESATIDDLYRLFSCYGYVKNVKIVTNADGRSKGYGFVTFETVEEAQYVQKAAGNLFLYNKQLTIGPAIKKCPVFPMETLPQENFVSNIPPEQENSILYQPGIPYMSNRLELIPYQPTMVPFYSFSNNYYPNTHSLTHSNTVNYQSYQF